MIRVHGLGSTFETKIVNEATTDSLDVRIYRYTIRYYILQEYIIMEK